MACQDSKVLAFRLVLTDRERARMALPRVYPGGNVPMAKRDFSYQGEKLAVARSSLMLPHSMGEEHSIAHAFHACSLGLQQFDVTRIADEDVRDRIERLRTLTQTEGMEDATGEGTWVHRARKMTVDEKRELSSVVDQLADWFNKHVWTGK
jgi:hypothetical protein